MFSGNVGASVQSPLPGGTNGSISNGTTSDNAFWSPPSLLGPTSILQRPPQLPPGVGDTNIMASGAVGDYQQIFEWVAQLLKGPDAREKALLELSKKREQYDDLALILWHSFGIHAVQRPVLTDTGVMSTLLQEIITVYPLLNPPELTPHASNRVCNALALLQCVASHPETREVFLRGSLSLTYSLTQHTFLCFYTPFSTQPPNPVPSSTCVSPPSA
jgi:CCR4-NOT transcription complex subunit 9